MSYEIGALHNAPNHVYNCPRCLSSFRPTMRGVVRRLGGLRGLLSKLGLPVHRPPYCAMICRQCVEVIGWEHPDGRFELLPVRPRKRRASRVPAP